MLRFWLEEGSDSTDLPLVHAIGRESGSLSDSTGASKIDLASINPGNSPHLGGVKDMT